MTGQPNGSAHLSNGTTSKIERYGWTLIDKPGVFLMIPKDQLRIDHTYQRQGVEKQHRIFKIAAAWSWTACGTLTVADRDGKFFVIDGQGRKIAADRRADINELPCMVYETTGAEQEARGFLNVNVDRRSILATQKFNALLAVRDPAALIVDEVVSRNHLHISKSGEKNSVMCVGILLQAAAHDAEKFRIAFDVVAELSRGHTITAPLMAGAFTLECKAIAPSTLSQAPWRDRFLRVGHPAMIESLRRSAVFYGSGSALPYAEGIANAMNKGMRHQRIEMPPRPSITRNNEISMAGRPMPQADAEMDA